MALKFTVFFNIQKRANGQTNMFLAKSFKKGQMTTLPLSLTHLDSSTNRGSNFLSQLLLGLTTATAKNEFSFSEAENYFLVFCHFCKTKSIIF